MKNKNVSNNNLGYKDLLTSLKLLGCHLYCKADLKLLWEGEFCINVYSNNVYTSTSNNITLKIYIYTIL